MKNNQLTSQEVHESAPPTGNPAPELITQFQSVPFLGKTIDCALIEGVPYVVVNSMIKAIGLAHRSAHSYIQNDEILEKVCSIQYIPFEKYKGQPVLCLPLEFVPGWLFSIEINKTKAEVKANLLAYRRDAHKVLFNHYFGEATKVSTGMKRKLEIEHKIKANNLEITDSFQDLQADFYLLIVLKIINMLVQICFYPNSTHKILNGKNN